MAEYKKQGVLKYVDKNGDVYLLEVDSIPTTPEEIGAVPLTHEGLKELLATGPMILTEGRDYGDKFPANAVKGQMFLLKV